MEVRDPFTYFGDDHPRAQVKAIIALIPLAQKRIKVRICVSAAIRLPKRMHAELCTWLYKYT